MGAHLAGQGLPPMRRISNGASRARALCDLVLRTKVEEGGHFRIGILKAILEGDPYSGFRKDSILLYGGKRFLVNRRGGMGIVSVPNYEPVCFGLMKQARGSLFVDIGANVGAYEVHFASNFGHVLAVEPGLEALGFLRQNLLLNGIRNVTVVDKAVSRKPGPIRLYHHKSLVNWSLEYESDEFSEVNSTSLDELLRPYPGVDIIKIDVEGAELDVIRSGESVLGKVGRVIIEVRNNAEPALKALMEAHGFLGHVLEDRRTEKNWLFYRTSQDNQQQV
jgi:FkbM family methyltransferase